MKKYKVLKYDDPCPNKKWSGLDKNPCGMCKALKAKVGHVGECKSINQKTGKVGLRFEDENWTHYYRLECLEEVMEKPQLGKKYKVVKKANCGFVGCDLCEGLDKEWLNKVGVCTDTFEEHVILKKEEKSRSILFKDVEEVKDMGFKVGSWYKIKAGFTDSGKVYKCVALSTANGFAELQGRPFTSWDIVEEVPEPVCIPADHLKGFEVGKYYKIKPHWHGAGQVFKCSKTFAEGSTAFLEGRSLPDGTQSSMWSVVECEVPEHLVAVAPPVASATPFASTASMELSILRGQLNVLRAQLIKEQESKVVTEKLSMDRQALLDKTQEELRLTVKRAAEVETSLLTQRNAAQKKLEESEEELLAARLELNALLPKYENASADVDKYIAAEARHNKRYAESMQEITQQRIALEAAADENDCLAEDLAKTKQLVTNTTKQLNETCKELTRLRDIEDEVNVRKWLVVRRHELALLLADRAATALSGIFSKHMAALGGLVAICFTVILVAKVLHGH